MAVKKEPVGFIYALSGPLHSRVSTLPRYLFVVGFVNQIFPFVILCLTRGQLSSKMLTETYILEGDLPSFLLFLPITCMRWVGEEKLFYVITKTSHIKDCPKFWQVNPFSLKDSFKASDAKLTFFLLQMPTNDGTCLLLKRFVFRIEASAKCEWLVTKRKGPREGQKCKVNSLARFLLPAFLCAQIEREGRLGTTQPCIVASSRL